MFANTYQSGFVSIFYSIGSHPLQLWDKQVKNGHIRRVVDDEVKSLVLEISGTNVATTYITCPLKPRMSLGIKLPFLVMIVKNMKKYFTFEIQILDDKDMHRRFRVSNFQSTTKVRPFCTTMPIGLSSGWNQVQFNLADFTKRAYGSTYIETTRVQIHANARLRRIYFSDQLYSDDELPNEYKLFLPAAGKKKDVKGEKRESKMAEEMSAPTVEDEEIPSGALPSPVPEEGEAPILTPITEASELVAEPPSELGEATTAEGFSETTEPLTTERTETEGEEGAAAESPVTAEGEAPPPTVEGAAPAEEGAPPVVEGEVQAAEGAPPAEEGAVPTEEGAPAEVTATPSKLGAVPSKLGQTPSRLGQTPSKLGQIPSKLVQTPSKLGPTPSKLGQTPSKMAASPSKIGTVPSKIEAVPSKIGAVPSKIGASPSKLGTVSSKIGAVPSKVGAVPSQMAAPIAEAPEGEEEAPPAEGPADEPPAEPEPPAEEAPPAEEEPPKEEAPPE